MIGLALVLFRMGHIAAKNHIPIIWAAFYFTYFVTLFGAFCNQAATLFTPMDFGWVMKIASTLMWLAGIAFCNAIKKTIKYF